MDTPYLLFTVILAVSIHSSVSVCPPGEIQCENGNCIPAPGMCNGTDDCGNDTDECTFCSSGGSFRCSDGRCVSDPFTCDPYLLLPSGSLIYRATLERRLQLLRNDSLESPRRFYFAIDFDYSKNYMFWLDLNQASVWRSQLSLNGSGEELLITSGLTRPRTISWDWTNQKLYVIDIDEQEIEVYDPQTDNRKVLVYTGSRSHPIMLITDPTSGWMYWSCELLSIGRLGVIERASMDGAGRTVIYRSSSGVPTALALDFETQTLYWFDALLDRLESARPDGSDHQILSGRIADFPWAMSYFEGSVYWTDINKTAILRVDVDSPVNVTTLFSGGNPRGIRVVSPQLQPEVPNPCDSDNGGCQYLCLLSAIAADGFTCACPDGLLESGNGSSCEVPQFGDLRLVQGNYTSSNLTAGRLEVYVNGTWGTICDDSFSQDEANVACNQLGFENGARDFGRSTDEGYGEGHGEILLSNVQCDREETQLISCSYNGVASNDCDHTEDVAVDCKTDLGCFPGEFRCRNGRCIPRRLRCNDVNNCGDGSDETCFTCSPGRIFQCGSRCDSDPFCGSTGSNIDECLFGLDNCHANAQCINTDGGFRCQCNSGLTGNGVSCSDIDECAMNLDNCDINARCINTFRSFFCRCNSGYTGNGVTCSESVDECALNTDNCDTNAQCINTDGGFICRCNSGFTGNGVTCSESVDECALNMDNCDTNAQCINTDGGFICRCNSGFTGNGVTCSDIDECAMIFGGNCDINARCINTDGSFMCRCNTGFTGNGVTCSLIGRPDIPAIVICQGGQFECSSGRQCVQRSDRCDSNRDCDDGSDEDGCATLIAAIVGGIVGSVALFMLALGAFIACCIVYAKMKNRTTSTTARGGALSTTSAATMNQTLEHQSSFLGNPRPQTPPQTTHVEMLISEPPPSYNDAFKYDKPESQVDYPQSEITLESDLSELPPPYPGNIPQSEQ